MSEQITFRNVSVSAGEIGHRTLLVQLAKLCACVAVPVAVWFAPLAVRPHAHMALAIAGFMISAWMTQFMQYAAAGMAGLALFWVFGTAKPSVIFSGFVDAASWFYLGAMLLGAMATKSGLPQRIANLIVSRVGTSYSRLLLGLILVDFILTFIIPSGAAAMVVMATIAMSLLEVFGVRKGSNIGRGMFLVITYTTSIFNKMIVAGTASVVARALIASQGGVDVSWGLWMAAFLPCAVGTILASWWLTLRLFPPEIHSLADKREHLAALLKNDEPWNAASIKALVLSLLALALWTTDWLHHIPAAAASLAIGLVAFMPFVNILDEADFRRVNLLPFLFVGAALGMSNVLQATGGLDVITHAVLSSIGPYLSTTASAIMTLYWGGFAYHLATASEVSMLATSMPMMMGVARAHGLSPAWIGMIWSFASGGKLFAYQSAVLVLGYGYGYFGHLDLLKLGALLTVVEFVLLFVSVVFFWPALGLVR